MRHQKERASPDEQLVNEHMLSQCMHRNFRVVRDLVGLYAECRDCSAQQLLTGRPSREQAHHELLAQQIRPAHNPTNGLQVERLMVQTGWQMLCVCRDGLWRCTATKGAAKMQSELHRTRSEAVIQVAAATIRKRLHKYSAA
jgi:hypothetical protein